MCESFSRAALRSPPCSGASIRLTASIKPRVASVVDASAEVAIKNSQSGSKRQSTTSAHAIDTEMAIAKKDSAMPAMKSRRGLPLRSKVSPWEINLPIKTTGCGNQRGSPTARSKRNALIRSAAEELQKTCKFIKRLLRVKSCCYSFSNGSVCRQADQFAELEYACRSSAPVRHREKRRQCNRCPCPWRRDGTANSGCPLHRAPARGLLWRSGSLPPRLRRAVPVESSVSG